MTFRRTLLAIGAAAVVIAVCTAAMVPLRTHLSVATPALILVIPVVVAVVVGGFGAGVATVAGGFLVYDVFFIPPYGTLTVGASQNWVALGVYAAVMLLVARAVAQLDAARTEARRREEHVRRLAELSEALADARSEADASARIVTAVHDALGVVSVALLLRRGDELVPMATAGEPWPAHELGALAPAGGVPVRVGAAAATGVETVALAVAGEAIGLLGLRGAVRADHRPLLDAFSRQIADTLERARLREQVVQAEVVEETERIQKALMGAVSHDLRTPLAAIKVSASTLLDPAAAVPSEDRDELLRTIDAQADRLSRLVTNLLDMSRVQAGVLSVERQPVAVIDLVADALAAVSLLVGAGRVEVDVASTLPLVDVDHVLIVQVLANLLENALRYSPEDATIALGATVRPDGLVELSVTDEGPGVAPADRLRVFELFNRAGPGEGSGAGLAIAKAFVEAHGQRIWVDDRPGGGASFRFTLAALEEG
ncbi:MAG: sensor histidine kinase [Acidimicrobiales bacterium]